MEVATRRQHWVAATQHLAANKGTRQVRAGRVASLLNFTLLSDHHPSPLCTAASPTRPRTNVTARVAAAEAGRALRRPPGS